MNAKMLRALKALDPCPDALAWAKKQRTPAAAWKACKRGDWMLWLLGRLSGPPESASRKKLVLCACECARLALKYVPAGEGRPRRAIETAEAWVRGTAGVTLADVQAAAHAAYAAAHAAYAAAAYAAAAAARAADAADAAARAAARAADAYAASQKTLAVCAAIVRKHYPKAPKLEAPARPADGGGA